jgi:hypothetical protein
MTETGKEMTARLRELADFAGNPVDMRVLANDV